jgi:hypothetical protein
MPPRIQFIRSETESVEPDGYLLLATIKQHLADHHPMELGDMQAWEICDRKQQEVL